MGAFLSRPAILAVASMVLSACAPAGGAGGGGRGGGEGCWEGRCDGFGRPPALAAIPLDAIAECTSEVNLGETGFGVADRVSCSFRIPEALGVRAAYVAVSTTDDPFPSAHSVEGERLRDGTPIAVRQFYADTYPVKVRVSLVFDLGATSGDIAGEPGSPSRGYRFGWEQGFATRADLARASAAAPLRVSLPFDLWPVVAWPSAELGANWAAGGADGINVRARTGFPVTSAELLFGGGEAATEIAYDRRRYLIASRAPSLHPLGRDVSYVPVPRGGAASLSPRLEIDFFGEAAVSTTITGPGYYVVDPAGAAVLTSHEALPPIAGAPGPEPEGDAGVDPGADAGPPVEPEPDAGPIAPPDPCGGSCSDAQVCVAARCVVRAMQTQPLDGSSSMYCRSATAACDAGDDGDCASGHACVGGMCRRLACQIQPHDGSSTMYCRSAYAPCEGDDAADCGADHTCVAGLCRRLACQIQPFDGSSVRYCRSAYAPCDSGSVDCASGHSCVDGLCRRDACMP